MFQCPSRGGHVLPADAIDETTPHRAENAAARRATGMRVGYSPGQRFQLAQVRALVAAAVDDCAPCIARARSGALRGRDAANVVVMLTEWLSEAVARAEAAGGPLPETAAGVLADVRVTRSTRLMAGLVPLAGPERPGGAVRVTRPEVARAVGLFSNAEWPMMFDDALYQMAAHQRH